MNLDRQRPTPIDGNLAVGEPEVGSSYIMPAKSEVAVREVSFGGKSISRELIEAVILSLIIFLVVQSVVQNRKVIGQSMEPTLHQDERLIVDRASYFQYDANLVPRLLGQSNLSAHEQFLLSGPQRGDIVIFRPPPAAHETQPDDYVKRVIGLPGETVKVTANKGVYVNGQLLNEPYIHDIPNYDWPTGPNAGGAGKVPAGQIFVLGDNRNNSSDSHIWGYLDINNVVGRAVLSYWPQDRFGLLPHPSYPNVDTNQTSP